MPDLSSQFKLDTTNCVANGQFETGANWTQAAGEDADIEIGDGRLICTGNGRNIVQQTIAGGNLQDGDAVLLMVEVVSGGGGCFFGNGNLSLTSGTHCLFCTVGSDMTLRLDFEESACEIDSVRLRKVTFLV